MLSIHNNTFNFFENSIIYFTDRFEYFDVKKLIVNTASNKLFNIKIAYSIDNQNWSTPCTFEEFEIDNLEILTYVYITLHLNVTKKISNNPTTLFVDKNIDNSQPELILTDIKYNNFLIAKDKLKFETLESIINKTPNFNIYDNQGNTIKRWLDTCSSLSYSHGHTCIYFKTEPNEKGTVNTFANYSIRDVVSIKRLQIMIVGNELPSERLIYSEWDMPLEDDFIIHIVDELFKNSFGNSTAPTAKDYLYLPLLNRLFRIGTVQPSRKRFMGVNAWWECYLGKYEEDETIRIDKNELGNLYGFDDSPDDISGVFNVIEELEQFVDDTLIDSEEIKEKSTDEKKAVNESYTNKLVDSTGYIDLKETDKQRSFYSKRLNIVSVNPDNNAFPITMYNAEEIDMRTVALTYDLKDAVKVSKNSLTINDELKLSYNFVLTAKFRGEIISNNLFTINSKRSATIEIINHVHQKTSIVDFEFLINEFYHIEISYKEKINQLSIKIYQLINKQKTIKFQNIYILNSDKNNFICDLSELILFGGKYLINHIKLEIDNNIIIEDNVNPVMQLRKFN